MGGGGGGDEINVESLSKRSGRRVGGGGRGGDVAKTFIIRRRWKWIFHVNKLPPVIDAAVIRWNRCLCSRCYGNRVAPP